MPLCHFYSNHHNMWKPRFESHLSHLPPSDLSAIRLHFKDALMRRWSKRKDANIVEMMSLCPDPFIPQSGSIGGFSNNQWFKMENVRIDSMESTWVQSAMGSFWTTPQSQGDLVLPHPSHASWCSPPPPQTLHRYFQEASYTPGNMGLWLTNSPRDVYILRWSP